MVRHWRQRRELEGSLTKERAKRDRNRDEIAELKGKYDGTYAYIFEQF